MHYVRFHCSAVHHTIAALKRRPTSGPGCASWKRMLVVQVGKEHKVTWKVNPSFGNPPLVGPIATASVRFVVSLGVTVTKVLPPWRGWRRTQLRRIERESRKRSWRKTVMLGRCEEGIGAGEGGAEDE
jgi:hypothetical protein